MNRQIFAFMMRESRSSFFFTIWQRDPGLNRMHWPAFPSSSLEALRMSDSAASDHPVHLARAYCLLHTNRVAVDDFSGKQISHCRETDMRMWKYVSFTRQTFRQIDGAQVVEENEWPDHAPLRCRQKPPHLEGANVADSLLKY